MLCNIVRIKTEWKRREAQTTIDPWKVENNSNNTNNWKIIKQSVWTTDNYKNKFRAEQSVTGVGKRGGVVGA